MQGDLMRAKSVLLLMLALGCGLVASIGITQVMAKRGSDDPASDGEKQQIFVALADIPTGDLITEEMIGLEEWPKDRVPEGALTKREDVEGRRPRSKVWKGEVILDNKLLAAGTMAGAAEEIPVGMRVISVTVDKESGISDLIRPGDRVDVLLYVKQTPGTFVETSVRTIFQDIKVFAVNDVYNIEATDGQSSINAKTVSLLVTPQQLEKFTLASELGQIRLALRSHEDKDRVDLAGAFPHELDEGEASDREMEELSQERPDTQVQGSQDLDNFLSMLNAKGAQASPPPATITPEIPAAPDTWTMQVLDGSDVREVVLQVADESPNGGDGKAESSGFNFWRMISPVRGDRVDTAPSKPDVVRPAQDGAEQPEEEQKEEEEPPPGEADLGD
jgi:pilus assembly protein CpaB